MACPRSIRHALFFLLCLCVFQGLPAQASPFDSFILHYHRSQADYEGWGLHVWGPGVRFDQPVTWARPIMPEGRDDFGVIFRVGLTPSASQVSFILHLGERKNSPDDVIVRLAQQGYEVWVLESDRKVYSSRPRLSGEPEPSPSPQASLLATTSPLPGGISPSPGSERLASAEATQLPAATLVPAKTQIPAATTQAVASPQTTQAPARQTSGAKLSAREAELEAANAELGAKNSELEEKLEALSKSLSGKKEIPILWWISLAILGAALTGIGATGWILYAKQRARTLREKTRAEEAGRDLLREIESKLMQKSTIDELTGLPNRSGLNQLLPIILAKARRYKKQAALLYIDLDHFKPINDTHGHEAGDYVLKTVAERFKECLRDSDYLCRLGGDEFVVLVEELLDARFLGAIAQKILSAAQVGFFIGGEELHVTASIGLAVFPHDGRDASSLLRNADAAMYSAKEGGKNAFHYYSAEQNVHALQRRALVENLEQALARREFSLVYQPIYRAEGRHIIGMEALARWNHKDLGALPPGQFLPLAEDSGLMEELGAWLVSSAISHLAAWRRGGELVDLYLNLSTRQFYAPGFRAQLESELVRSGCPASALVLELSEESLLVNPEESMDLLLGLKDLGLRILLDNFGSGYAALSTLRKYPLDAIKLDRDILEGVPGDADNEGMTKAALAVGKSFNLQTIVCGVESAEQADFLKDSGVSFIQGFYLSKPLGPDAILDLLKS